MNRSMTLALLLGGTLLMSAPHPAIAQPAYQPVVIGSAEGVLVPEDKALEFWQSLGRTEQPTGFWTPTAQEVTRLEENLPPYLRQAAPPRASDLPDNLAGYKRQYLGIVLGGHKVIYANFFCVGVVNSIFSNWQSQVVQVDDGGDCFFQVDYDTQSGQFSNLMVNGQA